MKKGLEGVVVANTAVSYIDGLKGKLVYRGYIISDLAGCQYEEVAYLLLYGKLPKKTQLAGFKRKLNSHMKLSPSLKRVLKELPKSAPAISNLRTTFSYWALQDKDAENLKDNHEKAISIMAVMPLLIACGERLRQGKKLIPPKKGLSYAAQFLYLLHGKKPSKEAERIFNLALILHAEHGFNASTFSSRVTVATLSDIYSGMVSAISTLKGPLHGGANIKAYAFFDKLGHKVKKTIDSKALSYVDHYVEHMLHQHIRIMGIGHRVYKVKDPRAILLEAEVASLTGKHKKYYLIAKEVESLMAEEKHLFPNVDFFSGIVYDHIGIRPHLFVNIFALARTSGWLAHMLEQYSDNRLIRPRSKYVGNDNLRFKPLSRR